MWLLESIHLIQDSPEAENPGIRSYEAALQACAQGWCRAKRQTHSFKKTMPNLLSKFDHFNPKGKTYVQWEFQDPKMDVLYHIFGHILGVYPHIGC